MIRFVLYGLCAYVCYPKSDTADDWKIDKNADKWNDAIRIVKAHGKLEDLKAIANKWAVHVGGEAGAKLLFKLDLISEAIEFCEDHGLWNVAFEMAKGNKQRTQQVH